MDSHLDFEIIQLHVVERFYSPHKNLVIYKGKVDILEVILYINVYDLISRLIFTKLLCTRTMHYHEKVV